VAVLAAFLTLSVAVAQQPAQVNVLNVPFRGIAAPAPTFDLVQSIVDYGPGARAGTTTTTAQNFLSVLEGELTITVGDKPEVVAAGKGIAEPPGTTITISNASTDKKARLFVSTLAKVAAVDQLDAPSGAGVTVFATARRTITNAPATVDVIQVVTQYDPGFRTANHTMNELHLFLMLTGTTDFGYLSGGLGRFGAGQQAVMDEGMAGWMANTTQEKSSFALTWVGTPGKPLTSAVQAPAPPKTGSGAAQDGTAIPMVVAATGLILVFAAASAFAAKRTRGARLPR
jgi:quercetin dioxygenase-like cupin family protein